MNFFREKEREGERETLICCSTYLCTHWSILTGDRTHNLGVLGRCSNQLSYPARQNYSHFLMGKCDRRE